MFPKLPTKFIVPLKWASCVLKRQRTAYLSQSDFSVVIILVSFFFGLAISMLKTSKLTLSTKAGTLSCDK